MRAKSLKHFRNSHLRNWLRWKGAYANCAGIRLLTRLRDGARRCLRLPVARKACRRISRKTTTIISTVLQRSDAINGSNVMTKQPGSSVRRLQLGYAFVILRYAHNFLDCRLAETDPAPAVLTQCFHSIEGRPLFEIASRSF